MAKGLLPARTKKRGDELLRLIQEIIIEEPKRFDIRLDQAFEGVSAPNISVRRFGKHQLKKLDFPACGTVACVAGWADILVNGQPSRFRGWGDIASSANRALGLSDEVTTLLFHIHAWPEEFRTRYIRANRVRRGKIAANYIDFFIANRHLVGVWGQREGYYIAATAHFAK
jgi:hypothetical protein